MCETAIFPDTNVFLHSTHIFDQLPWSEALGVGPVLLVVPPVVVAELDRKKRDAHPRVRERARKVVARLWELCERAMECRLGPRTRLRFSPPPDPSVFAERGLSSEEGDDQLLASAIEFRDSHPEHPVLVVTFDLGVSLKARLHGVPVRKLDDKWDLDRRARAHLGELLPASHLMTISTRWMEDAGPVPLEEAESAPGPSPPVVWVPAETFTMGQEPSQCPEAPTPLPEGLIDRGFWIHQHLVTNWQYAAFLNDLRHDEVDIRGFSVFRSAEAELYMDSSKTCCVRDGRHDFPVVGVDWDGANAYARRFWMRLPTEVEWEYAARGPESRVYPWGNDWEPLRCCNPKNLGPPWDPQRHMYADGRDPDADDWMTAHEGKYPKTTRTVPRPLPACAQERERWKAGESWCGAVDMAGNLMEWCQDVWINADGAPQEDNRVVRGGNYSYGEDDSKASCRRHHPPRSYCRNSVGFRCVTDWEAVEELRKRL